MTDPSYKHLHPVLRRRPPPHNETSAPRFSAEVQAYVRTLIKATGISSRGGDASLCKKCQTMFSARALFYLFTGGKLYNRGGGGGFKHSKASSFAARISCTFCQFIWKEDYNGDSSQPRKIRRLCEFVGQGSRSGAQDAWVYFRATVSPEGSWGGLAVRVESEKGRLLWAPIHDLITTTEEGSILAPHVAFRPIEWSGLDDHSAVALKALLDECQANHSECKPSGLTTLPTRLLQLISKPDGLNVKLHITSKGQTGSYAALSYCWGGPQVLRLQKANLDMFSAAEMDLKQLPKTLQDAANMTASLGLEFIWIDALCIIQDDDKDKAREINNMCSIYEQSAVTIVAATASSVRDGFLKPSNQLNKKHPTCSISIRSLRQPKDKSPCGLTFVPIHSQHLDKLPINERGWTFQESYIPPRLLVFGDHEPFLRCRTKDASSMAQTAIIYSHSRIEPRRSIDSALPKHIREEQHVPYKLREMWKHIVESYTERQFSFAEDRLLAIQGIVDFLENRYSDDWCYYGVWKSLAVGCLLWTVREDEPRGTRVLTAPTWSWLSIPYAVDMHNLDLLGSYAGDAVVKFDDNYPEQVSVTCAVVPISETAGDELEYWLDLEDEHEEDAENDFAERFALFVARTSNGTVLTMITVRCVDGVHIRRGVTEINNADVWLARQKETVIIR